MDLDDRVAFVVNRFNAMLAADGATLEVVGLDGDALTLRYRPGSEGACAACVLDPDDLDVLVAEALARQGAPTTSVRILRTT